MFLPQQADLYENLLHSVLGIDWSIKIYYNNMFIKACTNYKATVNIKTKNM